MLLTIGLPTLILLIYSHCRSINSIYIALVLEVLGGYCSMLDPENKKETYDIDGEY